MQRSKSENPKLFLVHTFRIIHMVLHIYGNKKDIDIKANKIYRFKKKKSLNNIGTPFVKENRSYK